MKPFYSSGFRLGILGGGQLGRMFIQEAANYNVHIHVLDPSQDAPCAGLCQDFRLGNFADFDTVYSFGKNVDLLTIEIEHVNVEALEKLKDEGVNVAPDPSLLRMIRDKGLQKQFYLENGIPTAPFHLVETREEIPAHLSRGPVMQKLRTGGYDGRGVQALRSNEDLNRALDGPSVLEELIPFEKELSVIVARNKSGDIRTFPLVEMVFNPEANLVEMLASPASVDPSVADQADHIARKIAEKVGLEGVLAVELFLLSDGSLLVNEMAPRPHNSGHHTIEGNLTSQYEQHMRAILNLPLGDSALIWPAAMVNILGEKGHSGEVIYEGLEDVMRLPGVYVHLYGKKETRPFRKMGHITIIRNKVDEAIQVARKVASTLRAVTKT